MIQTELHTYRLAFNNGDVFKTNAPTEEQALKNFRSTFSDLDIHQKGGTAFPFAKPKKMPEMVYGRFSSLEVAALTGVNSKTLMNWINAGAVRPGIEKGLYTWETVYDVRLCVKLRRDGVKDYLRKAIEARRLING